MATFNPNILCLQDGILALIGVSAGLKASLTLPICCVSLRDALVSPIMDEQLFGRLYAVMAGVNDPRDALLHSWPPPSQTSRQNDHDPQSLGPRVHTRKISGYHVSRGGVGEFPLPNSSQPLEAEVVRKRERQYSGCLPSDEVTSGEAHTQTGDGASPVPLDFISPSKFTTCEPVQSSFNNESETGLSCALPKVGCRLQSPGFPTRSGTSWRSRWQRNLATKRKPTGFFAFPAQRIGSQDVLMSVVPSVPPIIAVTCTTELSLFSLDGARIPPVEKSAHHLETSEPERMGPFGSSRGVTCEGGQSAMVEDAHDRDIRCLAVSSAGDRVATGSLDCTILVRSVPHRGWVRRLLGHHAGIRCLLFYGTRLVSADSLGVMSVWDVFPGPRRLHAVQGHSDSVQILTRTGGGGCVASGALDGRVVVWSVSAEGHLNPVLSYDSFSHPYRLASVGGCLVFTSSAVVGVPAGEFLGDAGRYDGDAGGNNSGMPASNGSLVSVVEVSWKSERRVCTGHRRVHHLVAGSCLGAVMVSPAEPWTCESGESSEEDEPLVTTSGTAHRDFTPRVCHVRAARRLSKTCGGVIRSGASSFKGSSDGGRVDSRRHSTFTSEWVPLSQDRAHQSLDAMKHSTNERGNELGRQSPQSIHGEDLESDAGALCTCAVFVGATVFLGYDTGGVWAHRVTDGRRLYRLRTDGSPVHLVEAEGSLYAYDSTGMVYVWMWVGGTGSNFT